MRFFCFVLWVSFFGVNPHSWSDDSKDHELLETVCGMSVFLSGASEASSKVVEMIQRRSEFQLRRNRKSNGLKQLEAKSAAASTTISHNEDVIKKLTGQADGFKADESVKAYVELKKVQTDFLTYLRNLGPGDSIGEHHQSSVKKYNEAIALINEIERDPPGAVKMYIEAQANLDSARKKLVQLETEIHELRKSPIPFYSTFGELKTASKRQYSNARDSGTSVFRVLFDSPINKEKTCARYPALVEYESIKDTTADLVKSRLGKVRSFTRAGGLSAAIIYVLNNIAHEGRLFGKNQQKNAEVNQEKLKKSVAEKDSSDLSPTVFATITTDK